MLHRLRRQRAGARLRLLARKYTEYPELMARLVDLFESAKAVDEAVSRINGSAPPGEHRRLLRVELTARSLEGFSTADRPIPPRTFDPGLLRAGGV